MDSLIGSGQFLDMGAIGKVGPSLGVVSSTSIQTFRNTFRLEFVPTARAIAANMAKPVIKDASNLSRDDAIRWWEDAVDDFRKGGSLNSQASLWEAVTLWYIPKPGANPEKIQTENPNITQGLAQRHPKGSTTPVKNQPVPSPTPDIPATKPVTLIPATSPEPSDSTYVSPQDTYVSESPLDNVMVQLGIVGALAVAGVGTVWYFIRGK